MYARMVRRLVYRAYENLNRRQLDEVLSLLADDVYFRFPGRHELGVEATSRAEVEAWLGRLFRRLPSLRFDVDEVLVSGPPWDARVGTRYRARTESATGEVNVYEGMQFLKLRWCTVVSEELFPDTQALADYLTNRTPGPTGAAAAATGFPGPAGGLPVRTTPALG